ncbi:hypothetical protein [Microbulbifer sp. PAAF003]|uniref:hypothetical protein n=1 Tax=Microbulbifer sp. PAAF003 TaxID=3243375 RepID=UPI00403A74F2
MKTYHLYKDKNSDSHYLVSHKRDKVINHIESSFEKAINKEYKAISRLVSKLAEEPKCLGIMEDFPIGDGIFEAKDGDLLDIWFSKNTLNNEFLILGTAHTLDDFHQEAVEDYGDMVGSISSHKKARAVYINAT